MATNFCPNCGAKIHAGAKFCSSCGARTSGGSDDWQTVQNDETIREMFFVNEWAAQSSALLSAVHVPYDCQSRHLGDDLLFDR